MHLQEAADRRQEEQPTTAIEPPRDLSSLASVRSLAPPLAVLSATCEETASSLADWPLWLPEAAQAGKPIVGFAGRIFSEHPVWRMRVPGSFLGATMRHALDAVERLLRSPIVHCLLSCVKR